MSARFTLSFTAQPEHIDVMGHVNNAVWVQWMEAIATAHWEAVASPAHRAAYVWVVTRHEIDYRGNVAEGARVRAPFGRWRCAGGATADGLARAWGAGRTRGSETARPTRPSKSNR